jgi:hypothetical protein
LTYLTKTVIYQKRACFFMFPLQNEEPIETRCPAVLLLDCGAFFLKCPPLQKARQISILCIATLKKGLIEKPGPTCPTSFGPL